MLPLFGHFENKRVVGAKDGPCLGHLLGTFIFWVLWYSCLARLFKKIKTLDLVD